VSAATSPEVIFSTVKEVWQQDIQALHRVRERYIRNQTALVNEIRGLLMEYGFIIAQGIDNARKQVPVIISDEKNSLTPILRSTMRDLHFELLRLTESIEKVDKQLMAIFKGDKSCQRIGMVEGIGVITATAIIGSIPPVGMFKNGRQFAAWLGLTPGHVQTGGSNSKPIMLGITKKGDTYLRKLLIQGSMSVAIKAKNFKVENPSEKPDKLQIDTNSLTKSENESVSAMYRRRKKPTLKCLSKKKSSESRLLWMKKLIENKCIQKASVALANRNARVIWALLKSNQHYDSTRGEGKCDAA
jgi:transposase